jgi:colanic acid biosynthesis glycosyl transferase WcaI
MSQTREKLNRPEKKENRKKRRLWVVTELYYPEETSTGYYLTKIAEGLAGDFEVRVICGQPNYSARGVSAPKFEKHRGVSIRRVFGTRFDKNVIPLRLLNMLSLSLSVFFKGVFGFKKNDLILVVTTPPLLPFVTALAAALRGAALIPLIHDNYPEILVAADKAGADSVFTGILNYLNRKLFERAFRIIVVGRDMRELVARKLSGRETEKIKVIPNWAELETVAPHGRDDNALLKELGLTDRLVFLYAGNMGFPNDIESFLEVAGHFRDDPRFHLIFLGTGVKRKLLETGVKSKNLNNITILDPRPRSEQNIFLNACDVAIVSLVDKMWGVSMPSRTYNILAAGKPILALCEKASEIDLVVREENIGWSIRPSDPQTLLETFESIYGQKDSLREMSARSRRAALAKYKLDDALDKYRTVLNEN